jgi:hypothetical protein
MQTTIARDGRVITHPEYSLLDWARSRCNILAEENASAAFIRGYLDAASGRPTDVALFVGEPFGADDYHAGFGLARYEIGPVNREEIAA